ncbi:GNAT family N-acetyltransferase [Pelobium sp.]|nr:GNAT family N-acetyltransferase [Pelobium sp.]MDA9555743.1 GNAT family N-acetyltransferase [Pelobium sp.]
MINASYEDKDLIIGILTSSFDKNESVNYIAKQDHKRVERIKSLMDYSFEMCYNNGNVYLTDDKKGCALVLYPHKKESSIQSILLDIKLILRCIGIGNIGKAMKRESAIKELQPKIPMYYLWFIGVDAKYQNNGIGSQLLEFVIADSEEKQLPVFLETSTLKNLPWYQKFGFKIYNELQLSYKLFFLKREFKV